MEYNRESHLPSKKGSRELRVRQEGRELHEGVKDFILIQLFVLNQNLLKSNSCERWKAQASEIKHCCPHSFPTAVTYHSKDLDWPRQQTSGKYDDGVISKFDAAELAVIFSNLRASHA